MRIRSLAWFAIAAQPLFIASWLIAGALQPGYSHVDAYVSALGAHQAEHPWILMTALIVWGLSVAALAAGLRAVLPRGRAAAVAVALFAVVAAGYVVAGLAQPSCHDALRDCGVGLHEWAAFVAALALIATPFAIGLALWPSPTAGAALSAGSAGLAIGVVATLLHGAGAHGGVERIEMLVAHVWFVIVAAGILYERRPEPRFSEPAPLRPRDFFGGEWKGEGQVRAWPYRLWSVAGPGFSFSRRSTWVTEDLGIVVDRAVLRNGRVEERVRYARLLDPTHIHVTSDDMPDGANILVDEQGYRIAPYKVIVPIGPLRLVFTCHDSARIEPDGSLTYEVYLRWHGLPVAQLDMRGRVIDTTPAPARATPAPAAS